MGLLDNLAGALGQGGAGAAIGELLGGQAGGLEGVVGAFDKAGLGDAARSWIAKGENLPVSADQIQAALGSGVVGQFAEKLGLDPEAAASQLARLLPQVIDQLTPDGKAPAGGLGGLLGGLKF